jgi:hypothetical protein
MIVSRSILLIMRNVSGKSCRENQNTNFVLRTPFFFESLAVYVEKYGRAKQATDNIIRRTRFEWWNT